MRTRLALVVFLLLARAAAAQNFGNVSVSEADYATWRKLSFAHALAEKRAMFDRANKAKYEAEYQQALKAAGWTGERLDEVGQALSEATDILAAEKGDVENEDPESTRNALKELHKVTLATARAHYKEIHAGFDDDSVADAQVRRERAEAAAGDPPTPAFLEGTWVADVDATLAEMGSAVAQDPKVRDGFTKATEGTSYQFGPGNKVVVTSKGTDGKPQTETGTWRIDGRRILFIDSRGKERGLDAGQKGKNLVLGVGLAKIMYRKK